MIVIIIKVLIDDVINQVVIAIMKTRFGFDNYQIAISRRARFVWTLFIISQSLIIIN